MSEEEMLKNIRKQIENTIKANECGLSNNDFKEDIEALELLHDRYLKEKEKNKELEETLKQTQDSWYEDTKKIELNNECEIALNNRIFDLEAQLQQEKEKNEESEKELGRKIKALDIAMSNPDYISKDKIIKFLSKYDKVTFIAKVDLQELLKERN